MCGCRNKAMREPTDASEPDTQAQTRPWGSETSNILRHHHLIIARYSIHVHLYVLATCIATYTAYHAQ